MPDTKGLCSQEPMMDGPQEVALLRGTYLAHRLPHGSADHEPMRYYAGGQSSIIRFRML